MGMKGSIKLKLLAVLAIIIIAVIGIPLSYDQFMGAQSIPDSVLYGLEKSGEEIRCTITLNKTSCLLELAAERDEEAALLKERVKRLFDEDEIMRYRMLILETENQASRLRIEALRD